MGTRVAALAFALLLGFPPTGANAAFPGKDGRIAYHVSDQIRTIEPDGSDMRILGPGVTPSWSPDGRHIVFCRLTERGNEVIVADADGSDERTVAIAGGYYRKYFTQPSFSPSGRRVLFTTGSAIVTVRLDGTGRRRILKGSVNDPVFAPDGSRIAFSGSPRNSGGWGIWTMRPNGSGLRRVTETRSYNDSSLDYRPDGRRILFQRLSPDQKGAFIIRPDGSGLRQVRTRAFPYSPVFSPTGDRLAMGIDRRPFPLANGCLELFTSAPGGTDMRQATSHCPDESLGIVSLSWQPLP